MKVYTFPYDETITPAMPVAEVRLISAHSQEVVGPVEAIVDSGSDGTMVPSEFLDGIGALSIGTAVMRGVWGQRRRVNIYLVNIEIGSYLLPGIHVASAPAVTELVLGRNVMNHLRLVLNGPANTLEIPAD